MPNDIARPEKKEDYNKFTVGCVHISHVDLYVIGPRGLVIEEALKNNGKYVETNLVKVTLSKWNSKWVMLKGWKGLIWSRFEVFLANQAHMLVNGFDVSEHEVVQFEVTTNGIIWVLFKSNVLARGHLEFWKRHWKFTAMMPNENLIVTVEHDLVAIMEEVPGGVDVARFSVSPDGQNLILKIRGQDRIPCVNPEDRKVKKHFIRYESMLIEKIEKFDYPLPPKGVRHEDVINKLWSLTCMDAYFMAQFLETDELRMEILNDLGVLNYISKQSQGKFFTNDPENDYSQWSYNAPVREAVLKRFEELEAEYRYEIEDDELDDPLTKYRRNDVLIGTVAQSIMTNLNQILHPDCNDFNREAFRLFYLCIGRIEEMMTTQTVKPSRKPLERLGVVPRFRVENIPHLYSEQIKSGVRIKKMFKLDAKIKFTMGNKKQSFSTNRELIAIQYPAFVEYINDDEILDLDELTLKITQKDLNLTSITRQILYNFIFHSGKTKIAIPSADISQYNTVLGAVGLRVVPFSSLANNSKECYAELIQCSGIFDSENTLTADKISLISVHGVETAVHKNFLALHCGSFLELMMQRSTSTGECRKIRVPYSERVIRAALDAVRNPMTLYKMKISHILSLINFFFYALMNPIIEDCFDVIFDKVTRLDMPVLYDLYKVPQYENLIVSRLRKEPHRLFFAPHTHLLPLKLIRDFLNATMTNQPSAADTRFDAEIKKRLDQFEQSGDFTLELPPMDREKRKRVHELARRMNLGTKSVGNEPNRRIVISRKTQSFTRAITASTTPIILNESTVDSVNKFIEKYPISQKNVHDFISQRTANETFSKNRPGIKNRPLIPPPSKCTNESINVKRRELPSFRYKHRVIDSINRNCVIIVSGGTGCGKTTQVPQFILEDACEKNYPVKIMCTQPRRLAAISISERVSRERGEKLGETVGYHIRLEQKTSDSTVLTYCTSGVLLRKLSADPMANGITHIILDEIHERETNTDYLLIALKQALRFRRDLKIILMSATIEGNMNLFETYFHEKYVDVIRIESKLFDVHKFFLDEVLAMIGYEPPESIFGVFGGNENDNFPSMDVWDSWGSTNNGAGHQQMMRHANTMPNLKEAWHDRSPPQYYQRVDQRNPSHYYNHPPPTHPPNNGYQLLTHTYNNGRNCVVNENGEWVSGIYQTSDGDVISENEMNDYMDLIVDGNEIRPIVPDFQPKQPPPLTPHNSYGNGTYGVPGPSHQNFQNPPQSFYTPNNVPPSHPIPPQQSFSAISTDAFGAQMRRERNTEQLMRHDLANALPNRPPFFVPDVMNQLRHVNFPQLALEQKYLACGGSQYDESVDYHLVSETIRYCADSPIIGAILVFLPGFDDINKVREEMESWKCSLTNYSMVEVICLHSQMNSFDQNEVFKPVARSVRKIILSTNIAEASLTIEDVIFVIDTGKVKEKVYRHDTKFSQLKVATIAKSNAEQRAGRAGRVASGYCFRLFSQRQYNEMAETQVAEMRRAAIYDVCLHAKLFAPKDMRVADFLTMAPEPPTRESIEQSMDFLEKLGALYSESKVSESLPEGDFDDVDPELTELGRIMAQMPLDPQLARLIIFGLALKCLKPIVNLVALLSYRDPYVITTATDRELMNKNRDKIARRDFSDHLVFIKLIDEFSNLPSRDTFAYCRANYLNASTMRMIVGVRKQILNELARVRLIEYDRDVMSALSNYEYNKYAECWPVVQAAISAGCYPSVGVSIGNSAKLKKIQTHAEKPSTLHPSTVIKRQTNIKARSVDDEPELQFVVYQEMSMIDGGLVLRTVSVVPPVCILLFTGCIQMKMSVITEYALYEGANEDILNRPQFGSIDAYEIEPWYAVRGKREVSE
ncbi:unnamed protein product [Caenorhabditis bovis]|uniref:RNA helicase n=1 Tax=Caenorhabditis bovis TaxID=2654633 RepID=A0A8S1F8N5_9PELO|nr:unnamed protein product [Caenorhabditis bovis]